MSQHILFFEYQGKGALDNGLPLGECGEAVGIEGLSRNRREEGEVGAGQRRAREDGEVGGGGDGCDEVGHYEGLIGWARLELRCFGGAVCWVQITL